MPSISYEAGGEPESRSVDLYKNITTVGSSEECDVYVRDDPKVAATHATILFDGRGWAVQTAARWHAVFVNGKRRKSSPLSHGDVIRVARPS